MGLSMGDLFRSLYLFKETDMKIIIVIVALTSGLVAALASFKKSNHVPAGYVIADSNEMEATWYPE